MLNIVVVAGGKQTRYNELSVFPKVLLPSKECDSILMELVKKTSNFDVKRYLVVNSVYSKQVEAYFSVNNLKDKISVIESTNTCGSFNTLREVREKLPSENVLFIWSDLTLSSFDGIIKLCERTSTNGIIFTNNFGRYRYKTLTFRDVDGDKTVDFLKEAVQVVDYSGNVPGMYFFKDISFIKPFEGGIQENEHEADLVDQVNLQAKTYRLQTVDLENIGIKLIEYRDIKVYKDLLKSNYKENICQTRFFNKLIVDDEHKRVTKTVVDLNYQHLLQKEIEWYKLYSQLNTSDYKCTPRIFSNNDDSFTMEYLEGYLPLHCVLDQLESKCEISKIKRLYENLLLKLDTLQRIQVLDVPVEVFKKDLHKEVVDKVIERCEKIQGFLLSYDREELESIITKTYDNAVEYALASDDYDDEQKTLRYYFCHGDLNGSNVMVEPNTLDVKFIDPRGYFGKTKMYGWKPYEMAKILYCLYGYDDFNLKPQVYLSDWPRVRQSLEYSGIRDNFTKLGYQHLVDLVGIVYIALAGYISQDIMKANIAYEYGMRILKRNS